MKELYFPDFIQIPGVVLADEKLNTLDALIYGIIYWYTKLKLQRCVLKNQAISELLKCSVGSVANSITRLTKYGYVESIYERSTHIRELVPLVSYQKSTSSTDDEHFIHRLSGTSSTDESTSLKVVEEPNKINRIIELNNKQKEIIKKKYSSREDILEEDLEEIANHYQVTVAFVKSKFEDVCLWEDSKPGRMKNRNWRMTLMAWVKKDAIKIRQESYGKSTIGFINTD